MNPTTNRLIAAAEAIAKSRAEAKRLFLGWYCSDEQVDELEAAMEEERKAQAETDSIIAEVDKKQKAYWESQDAASAAKYAVMSAAAKELQAERAVIEKEVDDAVAKHRAQAAASAARGARKTPKNITSPSEHTKAPWNAEGSKVYTSEGLLLAQIEQCHDNLDGEKAKQRMYDNARFIAQAPKMEVRIMELEAELAELKSTHETRNAAHAARRSNDFTHEEAMAMHSNGGQPRLAQAEQPKAALSEDAVEAMVKEMSVQASKGFHEPLGAEAREMWSDFFRSVIRKHATPSPSVETSGAGDVKTMAFCEELRKECNKMTPEQRREALAKGIELILEVYRNGSAMQQDAKGQPSPAIAQDGAEGKV